MEECCISSEDSCGWDDSMNLFSLIVSFVTVFGDDESGRTGCPLDSSDDIVVEVPILTVIRGSFLPCQFLTKAR